MDDDWKELTESLRVTVICSWPTATEIAHEQRTVWDAMRGIRRDFERGVDLSAVRIKELGSLMDRVSDRPSSILYEPTDVLDWRVEAGLYKLDGELWWMLQAKKKRGAKRKRRCNARDRADIAGVIRELGGNLETDRVSILPIEDLVKRDTACSFTWKNAHELLEIRIRDGARESDTIVPGYDLKIERCDSPIAAGYTAMDWRSKRKHAAN